jgi:tungstate transport system ATP-binding protein
MTNHVPCFQLQNVKRAFGDAFTLEINHLTVYAGETLTLLGPTGAGKSTLLRIFGGLENHVTGSTHHLDTPFHPESLPLRVRRGITLVFQYPQLLNTTVKKNVEFGLRLRDQRPQSDRVQSILHRLKLAHLQNQPVRSLSGGQVQLTALARALVLQPTVLLLDEPTSHLDPAHVLLVEETIQQEAASHSMTVVWATHNLFQSQRVSDRVAFLLDGQLVEVATPQSLFTTPQDPRTAAFVRGEMVC